MLPVFMLVGLLVGLLFSAGMLLYMPGQLPTAVMALLLAGGAGLGAAAFAALYWFVAVPGFIKALAAADFKRRDVLELVTHDNRSILVPVRLEEGSIIVPEDRSLRERLVLVTTPDAATPIEGS